VRDRADAVRADLQHLPRQQPAHPGEEGTGVDVALAVDAEPRGGVRIRPRRYAGGEQCGRFRRDEDRPVVPGVVERWAVAVPAQHQHPAVRVGQHRGVRIGARPAEDRRGAALGVPGEQGGGLRDAVHHDGRAAVVAVHLRDPRPYCHGQPAAVVVPAGDLVTARREPADELVEHPIGRGPTVRCRTA
jgi:hypothetical protein